MSIVDGRVPHSALQLRLSVCAGLTHILVALLATGILAASWAPTISVVTRYCSHEPKNSGRLSFQSLTPRPASRSVRVRQPVCCSPWTRLLTASCLLAHRPGRINPKDPKHNYAGHAIQLAEAGTLALEYTRLSQLTGNRTYFDLAQRGMDYLDQVLAPKSPFPPLLPTMFSTETWRGGTLGTYSFGGMADSAVEYLIKQSVAFRRRTL